MAQQQALQHYEPLGAVALLGQVAKLVRDALAQASERWRLYQELAALDHRELADLRLQPHDIVSLINGQSVPATEFRNQFR